MPMMPHVITRQLTLMDLDVIVLLFSKEFAFDSGGIIRHIAIFSGTSDLWFFSLVKEGNGAFARRAADQPGGVSLRHGRLLVGTVPGPVDFIRRDSLKVSLLTMEALFLDEEPNLPFLDVIDLLRLVDMGPGVITGRPRRDHQATLVPKRLPGNHRTFALVAGSNSLAFRHALALYMKRHFALLPICCLGRCEIITAPPQGSTNRRAIGSSPFPPGRLTQRCSLP